MPQLTQDAAEADPVPACEAGHSRPEIITVGCPVTCLDVVLPANASCPGVLTVTVVWVCMPAVGITGVLSDVVAVAGLLAAMFCILTSLAMMACYRRRIIAGVPDFLATGILPPGAAVFLGSVAFPSHQLASAGQKRTIVAIVSSGLVMMLLARFRLRSPFFWLAREKRQAGALRFSAACEPAVSNDDLAQMLTTTASAAFRYTILAHGVHKARRPAAAAAPGRTKEASGVPARPGSERPCP